MHVVYYTSGIPGIGRIARGIAIRNALVRRGLTWDFTILSGTQLASVADDFEIAHVEIPLEDENDLSEANWPYSVLYKTLTQLEPDTLLVDRMWYTLYHFIDRLPCKKIFFSIQVHDLFFTIHLPESELAFNSAQYDRVMAIEPFASCVPMQQINPVIIRNREEIYDRDTARDRLGLISDKRACLVVLNYKQGYFERLKHKYAYLDGEYEMVYSTNLKGGGIFPIVDYYNAVDLVICAAGYTQFWEVIYFEKEAILEKYPLHFSSMQRRIEECSDHQFEINGADQLVQIMLDL